MCAAFLSPTLPGPSSSRPRLSLKCTAWHTFGLGLTEIDSELDLRRDARLGLSHLSDPLCLSVWLQRLAWLPTYPFSFAPFQPWNPWREHFALPLTARAL